MKKILIYSPFGGDANSFWRCMGPMGYLARHSEGEIQLRVLTQGEQFNWATLADIDLLFLHRPCNSNDITMMHIARNMNVPVWVDYDDWLFNLPEWNPHKNLYRTPALQNAIATCIACADIVSTTTQALSEHFSKLNPHTVIIPNAYRSDLFPYRSKVVKDRQSLYAWRGTSTHEGDLMSVLNAFSRLEQTIHFLGDPPYSMLCELDPGQYKTTQMSDVVMYWKSLTQLEAKVFLNPLHDCFFNHCKSNIAWIEAIHGGALCVAPKEMSEWKHPGVVAYDAHDWQSFLEAATQAMAMEPSKHRNAVSEAYDYIRAKYDISVINPIRQAVINSVFTPSFERNSRDPYNQMVGMWALSVLKGERLPKVGDESNEGKSV